MHALREFTSDDDLDQALSVLNYPPYMIPAYNIVRNCRIRRCPVTNFRIFGYPSMEPKLWLLRSENPFGNEFLFIWSLPWQNPEKDEFSNAMNQLTKLIELFSGILIIHPNYLSDKISIYTGSQTSNITYMYYMDQKQQEMVMKTELHLPVGYYYNDEKPEDDAPIINDTWQYTTKADYQCIKAHLQTLPNVIIRHQEQPVAYEMLGMSGLFHHHFVHEEHRRQGLGKHVELRLSQKVIQDGLWPCKTVTTANDLVIAWSDRSPYWSRYNNECGNPITINYNRFH